MSNKYWVDKTNETDIVLAEDFNEAFESISSDIEAKVDKVEGKGLSTNDYTTEEKEKLSGLPEMAYLEYLLDYKADKQNSSGGGEIGSGASASMGGAVGNGSQTKDGFAGGNTAVTMNHDFELIDAIQLGQGVNPDEKSFQVYGKKVLSYDKSGTTTDDRWFIKDVGKLSALATTDKTSVIGAINELVTNLNGYAPLDASGKIPNEYLYGKTVKEYGVRWNGTSSTVCERLGDAVGLVANAHLGSADAVVNDFDSIYPWSDIRLCNLDENGNVLAYIGEPNFARDGSNGDVMVEIPKFYYKRTKVGIVEEWWICELPIGGYELHPLFIDGGIEMNKAYISAYNLSESADGTKGQSISGAAPLVRKTRAQFRTLARAKGSIWSIEDASSANARQMLYMIEYANTNSQLMLGNGISAYSYSSSHIALEPRTSSNEFVLTTAQANTYVVGQRIEIGTTLGVNDITSAARTILSITADSETEGQSIITFSGAPVNIAVGNIIWNVAPFNGECDILNGESGYIGTNGKNDVSYRGVEGFHGKLHCFIDGININDRIVYYCNKISSYADDVWDGDYNQIGYVNSDQNGYVTELGYDVNAPWIMFPVATGGGSTTYIPDYYIRDTGKRQPSLGGNLSSDLSAGVFYWYCAPSFLASFVYYGTRLLVKKP